MREEPFYGVGVSFFYPPQRGKRESRNTTFRTKANQRGGVSGKIVKVKVAEDPKLCVVTASSKVSPPHFLYIPVLLRRDHAESNHSLGKEKENFFHSCTSHHHHFLSRQAFVLECPKALKMVMVGGAGMEKVPFLFAERMV